MSLLAAAAPDPSEALLAFVRGERSSSFSLTVSCLSGTWEVRCFDHLANTVREGHGPSLAAAWAALHQIHPAPSDTERKATARGLRVVGREET